MILEKVCLFVKESLLHAVLLYKHIYFVARRISYHCIQHITNIIYTFAYAVHITIMPLSNKV